MGLHAREDACWRACRQGRSQHTATPRSSACRELTQLLQPFGEERLSLAGAALVQRLRVQNSGAQVLCRPRGLEKHLAIRPPVLLGVLNAVLGEAVYKEMTHTPGDFQRAKARDPCGRGWTRTSNGARPLVAGGDALAALRDVGADLLQLRLALLGEVRAVVDGPVATGERGRCSNTRHAGARQPAAPGGARGAQLLDGGRSVHGLGGGTTTG